MNTPDRLAVISDVHGNTWALEAVLADISRRGIETVVNLGDSLYGPLDPVGAADLLMQACQVNVRGNQDRLLLDPTPEFRGTPRFQEVVDSLTPAQTAWLAAHVERHVLGELYLCHGSPRSDTTYLAETITPACVVLASPTDLAQRLEGIAQGLVLCGHSHSPRTVFLPDGRLVVNPGSVGLPAYTGHNPYPHVMQAGSPHARYAVLGKASGGWQVEHIAVPYDWQTAAQTARKNGRPDWSAWLSTGRADDKD